MTTLEDVYNYEPVPPGLSKEESAFIIGAQANVWTEYILNFEHVEYMAVPRMIALSEVLWSTNRKAILTTSNSGWHGTCNYWTGST